MINGACSTIKNYQRHAAPSGLFFSKRQTLTCKQGEALYVHAIEKVSTFVFKLDIIMNVNIHRKH